MVGPSVPETMGPVCAVHAPRASSDIGRSGADGASDTVRAGARFAEECGEAPSHA
jgi:hypothetical protein